MGECRGRRGVCQVIRRDIDCLYGSDGTLLGGSDPLLQGAHFRSQCGLVTNGGRHTAQQRGNLGTRLGETEDVINEQKDVLLLDITEIFRHGQAGQADTHPRSRRLVHLAVDQGCFVNNAGFLHFTVKVIAFTGTLADACKYGQTAVGCRDVVDQLHDQDGLAYAGAAEQADLTALGIGADQVNDLDTGLQDLGSRRLIFISGSRPVDRPFLRSLGRGHFIYRLAQQIEYTTQAFFTDGNRDRSACIDSVRSSDDSVG